MQSHKVILWTLSGELPARNNHSIQRSEESEDSRVPSAAGHCQQGPPSQPAVPVRNITDRECTHLRADSGEGKSTSVSVVRLAITLQVHCSPPRAFQSRAN